MRNVFWSAYLFGVIACGITHALEVTGTVVDVANRPVAQAAVRLAGGATAVTDQDGAFAISGEAAVSAARRYRAPLTVSFGPRYIAFDMPAGQTGRLALFNALGREAVSVPLDGSGRVRVSPLGAQSGGLSDGSYICEVRIGDARLRNRALVVGNTFRWRTRHMRAGVHFDKALAKSLTVLDSLIVTREGYHPAIALITRQTVTGLTVRLYPETLGAPGPVTVRETTWTADITIGPIPGPLNSDDGIWASKGYGWEPIRMEQNGVKTKVLGEITREISGLIVDNGLIRVLVSPRVGMRVVQATNLVLNKTMFYVADPVQGYRIWDIGGVEGSWPFFEHGLHIMAEETESGFQSGGYRIVREPDGSAVVAMNMHFEGFQDSADGALQGRYSDRPLSSMLRVSPGSAMFDVTYRVDNPNPTPRSNRVWNDALFDKGSPDAHIIIPARWAVFHYASEIYDLAEFHGKPQEQWYSSSGYRNRSMFAVYGAYPFVGVYYPSQNVNRIRIHDPQTAPGIKCYIQESLDFIEFWGSTVALFEDPGTFVGPYQPTSFTNSYYMTTGDIGPLSYANSHVALGVDTAAHTFKLTAPAVREVSVRDFDGAELAAGMIGPTLPPLAGSCPQNQIVVVAAGGGELMRESFPLSYPDNLDQHYDSLLWAAARSTMNPGGRLPDGFSGCGSSLDDCRGFNYELEGLQSNTRGVRDYHGIKAAVSASSGDAPAYLLSLARVCYRYGCFDRAIELCDMITTPGHAQEIAFLKGLIDLEQGQTPDFSAAGPAAGYHRALAAVAAGDMAGAISLLQSYVREYPDAFRPAVALAYLDEDLGAARALEQHNPASIELTWVLSELGDPDAARDLSGLIEGNTGAAEALERFQQEVQNGRWIHVPRWKPFPGCTQLYLL